MNEELQNPVSSPRGFGIPLLIGLIAFAAFLIFQTTQIVRESTTLSTAYEGQNTPLQESKKAREQLEAVAQKTADLAAKGNVNAQAIVADLARQGIKIDAKK